MSKESGQKENLIGSVTQILYFYSTDTLLFDVKYSMLSITWDFE